MLNPKITNSTTLSLSGGTFEANTSAKQVAHHQAIVDTAAQVLVLRGYGPHSKAEVVNELLPQGRQVHSDLALRKITGGYQGLIKRIAKGDLFAPGALGRWSGGLMTGLRLSGALKQMSSGHSLKISSWIIFKGFRPALDAVLLKGGLPMSLVVQASSREVALYRFWGGNLGADDPVGVDVVAGLLMGAIVVRVDQNTWLGIPPTAEVRALLEHWGIPIAFRRHWCRGKPFGNGKGIVADLVSPFFGALFSRMMPMGMEEWYMGMDRPGMCPLLPWAFLRMAGGRVSDEFPRKGLPFLIARDNLLKAGVPLGSVHEKAVRELGLIRVDPRLRVVWAQYMKAGGLEFPFKL